MRRKNISFLTIASGVIIMIQALLLASCNLFIEDEQDEGFVPTNVPVHTGWGYDEPVDVSNDYCKMVFQYNSNVNVLSDEAKSYIIKSRIDSTGRVGYIDFDIKTPKELLPVTGEIVLSGISSKLPEGMAHHVLVGNEWHGVYRVFTCAAQFEDMFKQVDFDMDVSKALVVQGLAEESITDSTKARQTRIADEVLMDGEKRIKEKFPIILSLNLSPENNPATKDGKMYVTGSVSITSKNEIPSDNTLDMDMLIRARALKINDDVQIPFGIHIDVDYDYQPNLEIKGSGSLVWTLMNKDDIFPATWLIPLGDLPIVIKACCGFKINLGISLTSSFQMRSRLSGHAIRDIDIQQIRDYDNPVSRIASLAKDLTKWKLNYDKCYFTTSNWNGVSGSIWLEIILSPGAGLFIAEESIRAMIAPKFEGGFEDFIIQSEISDYGQRFQNNEGIYGKFDLGIGAAFTSASAFFTSMLRYQRIAGNSLSTLKAYVATFFSDETTDEDESSGIGDAVDLLVSELQSSSTDEIANGDRAIHTEALTFGPVYMGDIELFGLKDIANKWSKSTPWLPKMKDNSWKWEKNAYTRDMETNEYARCLRMSYRIEEPGCICKWEPLTPCMLITDKDYHFKYIAFQPTTRITDSFFEPFDFDKYGRIVYSLDQDKLPKTGNLKVFPGYYRGNIDDLSAEQITQINNGESSAYSDFVFDKEQIVNIFTPPTVKLKSIKCEKTEELGVTAEYPVERTFFVRWEISGKDYVADTGVSWSGKKLKDKHTKVAVTTEGDNSNGAVTYSVRIVVKYSVNTAAEAAAEKIKMRPFLHIQSNASEDLSYVGGPAYEDIIPDGATIVFDSNGNAASIHYE